MTRSASILRALATIVAGGSLLAAAPPVQAPEAAAEGADRPVGALGPAILGIAPLRVEIEGAGAGATVRLTNSSDHALPVQARLFAWSQENGEDVYAPSSELVVSPSITSIPSGQTQIVRVLRKGAVTPGEKRFRLAVDQLPDPAQARPGQALTRIRFTLPVFVDRDKAAPAALAWRIADDRIELANTGGTTARVLEVQVKTADGRIVPVERNALRYVLGNSTIAWPLGNGCALGPVRVTAQIDGQAVDGVAQPACG
jgi:fimbrial chaperone protein